MIMMMEGRPEGRPDCLSGVDEGSREPGSGRVLGSDRSVNVPVKIVPAQIVCVRSVNSGKGNFVHKVTACAANMFR